MANSTPPPSQLPSHAGADTSPPRGGARRFASSRAPTSRAGLGKARATGKHHGEVNLPSFFSLEVTGDSRLKPPRPLKLHVQPRTLPPHTPGQPPTGPTVSAPAGGDRASTGKAPPPERSTPRLGGPRRIAPPPLEAQPLEAHPLGALRAPPAERSTPRLGGPRPTPPGASSSASGSDDVRDDTLLITRRKQHLVAQATTDPDKSLYGSLGAKTHHSIQLAADENARRIWAAASPVSQRLPRTVRIPDTRWVTPALYAGTLVMVVFGFWLWNFKVERNSIPDHVTRGELPAPGAPPAAALVDTAETRAATPSQATTPDETVATTEVAPKAEESAPPAGSAPTRSLSSPAPRVTPQATASASTGRARPSGAPKKAPEQRIFTDAPF